MRSTRRVLQRNRNLSVLYKKTRSNYLQTNRTAMGTKMAGAFANIFMPGKNKKENTPGEGENTLRRLALFVYLDHPTKNDVTSGKKVS